MEGVDFPSEYGSINRDKTNDKAGKGIAWIIRNGQKTLCRGSLPVQLAAVKEQGLCYIRCPQCVAVAVEPALELPEEK